MAGGSVVVLVGTRNGGIIFRSDVERAEGDQWDEPTVLFR